MTRLERLMKALPDKFDAAIVVSPANRRYLLGFSSSAGLLLLTRDTAVFLIDSRYIEAARARITCCEVELEKDLAAQLGGHIKRLGCKTVGIESGAVSVSRAAALGEMAAPARILGDGDFHEALMGMRRIKDAEELGAIREAQRITDEAFTHVLNYIKPGASELDLMMVIGERMARLGCEKRSFNMIFTSGAKTSLPHGGGELRNIEAGDLVMMDIGSMVNGYLSDMTRTVAAGEPGEEKRRVYAAVLEAQRKALGVIRAGIPCNQVDRAARELIDSGPYRGLFGHGLGHSLGLEIHEDPRFNEICEVVTEPGMVVTVEPGIYLPGRFGVRIEDMIAVTEDGCENLTHSPKELLVL